MEVFTLHKLLETTLIGLFFGTFGTTIGGILGSSFHHVSNKAISFILEFSARADDGYHML